MNYLVEGYSVKKVHTNEHSHGSFFDGSLYRGSKEVASFEEKGDGAPMQIWYVNDEEKEDFQSVANLKEEDCTFEVDAIVIEEMVNTFLLRKRVMSGRKKKVLIFVDGENGMVDEEYEINSPYSKSVANVIAEEFKGRKYHIGNEVFDLYPDGVDRVVQVSNE